MKKETLQNKELFDTYVADMTATSVWYILNNNEIDKELSEKVADIVRASTIEAIKISHKGEIDYGELRETLNPTIKAILEDNYVKIPMC